MGIDKTTPFMVIDVGGGSTEVSVFENGVRTASKSFRIGTIRLLKEKVSKDIRIDISILFLFNTIFMLFGLNNIETLTLRVRS